MKRTVSILLATVMVMLCVCVFTITSSSETLPAAVDLSTTIHLPPISNQNDLGSCVSMAVAHMQFTNAYSRYIHNQNPNITWDPSSGQAKYVFSPRFTFNNAGASTEQVYRSIMEQGIVLQTLSAFSGGVTGAVQASQDVTYDWATQDNYVVDGVSYHIWEEAQKYRISGFDQVWLSGEQFGGRDVFSITTSTAGAALVERIKSQLNAGNVVVTGGYPNTWTNETPVTISSKGTYGRTGDRAIAYSTGTPNGGHQVAIIGYDDNITCVKNGVTLRGAFKVANSWGNWYNSGCIWMMYDALNGNGQSAYSALNVSNRTWTMDQMVFLDWRTDLLIGAPSVQASVKLKTTKTDAFKISLVRVDNTTGATESFVPMIERIGHPTKYDDGVTRNFYGHLSSTPVEGELSFNFDELIKTIPSGKTVDDYYWGVRVEGANDLSSTVQRVRLLKNGVLQYEQSNINETVDMQNSRFYLLDPEKTMVTTDTLEGVTIVPTTGSTVFADKGVPYSFTLNIQSSYKKTAGMAVYANGETLIDDENGVYTFTPGSSTVIRVTGVVPKNPALIPINSYNGQSNFESWGDHYVYIVDIRNQYVNAEMYESGVNSRYTFRVTADGVTYEFKPSSIYNRHTQATYRKGVRTMAKRVLILACVGFPVGVLIAFAIAFFSGESMVFYSGLLLSRVGGNASAATAVNILVCGLYGAACMMGTVFYDIDEWPLLLATVLHYLIVTMGSLACSLLLGWGDGIKGWLVIGAIQTVIFFLIWLCMFLRYKAEVRKLNELNRKERGGDVRLTPR